MTKEYLSDQYIRASLASACGTLNNDHERAVKQSNFQDSAVYETRITLCPLIQSPPRDPWSRIPPARTTSIRASSAGTGTHHSTWTQQAEGERRREVCDPH